MQTASDGGGGRVRLEAGVLTHVAQDLQKQAVAMGDLGGTVPAGDYGLAAGVVEGTLSSFLSAADRLSRCASTIGGAVRAAVSATSADDAAAAERMLVDGGSDG